MQAFSQGPASNLGSLKGPSEAHTHTQFHARWGFLSCPLDSIRGGLRTRLRCTVQEYGSGNHCSWTQISFIGAWKALQKSWRINPSLKETKAQKQLVYCSKLDSKLDSQVFLAVGIVFSGNHNAFCCIHFAFDIFPKPRIMKTEKYYLHSPSDALLHANKGEGDLEVDSINKETR